MSEQNVEFVKGLYGAAEAFDKQQLLEALPALIEQSCDPEIEWFEDPQRADSRIYRGHEESFGPSRSGSMGSTSTGSSSRM